MLKYVNYHKFEIGYNYINQYDDEEYLKEII